MLHAIHVPGGRILTGIGSGAMLEFGPLLLASDQRGICRTVVRSKAGLIFISAWTE
jgi:hypothetical protein